MTGPLSLSTSKDEFKKAVETDAHLTYCMGLTAIPPSEGGGQITAAKPSYIAGSVNIDRDCTSAFPNDNRWDFVVGMHRRTGLFAHFIEVHSATSGEVSCMQRKLRWLQAYLQTSCCELNKFPKQFHWVASSGIKIPKHVRQYRQLQTMQRNGLRGPVKHLVLS